MKPVLKCTFQSWVLAVGFLSLCSRADKIPDVHEKVNSIEESCNDATNWCSASSKHGVKQDVYEFLWTNALDIAQKTLNVSFLQHMELGDLQADDYVTFTIQDIYYLMRVTDMLREMEKKVQSPADQKLFFTNRRESYEKFTKELLNQFNFDAKVGPNIKPIPAMAQYISDYKAIMNEDPIFFAVSLLPCSRLWKWIANQLKETNCNAYFTWKKNNMGGSPEKHYKALLNKYLKSDQQIKRASEIFRKQMQNEMAFFAASLKG